MRQRRPRKLYQGAPPPRDGSIDEAIACLVSTARDPLSDEEDLERTTIELYWQLARFITRRDLALTRPKADTHAPLRAGAGRP